MSVKDSGTTTMQRPSDGWRASSRTKNRQCQKLLLCQLSYAPWHVPQESNLHASVLEAEAYPVGGTYVVDPR